MKKISNYLFTFSLLLFASCGGSDDFEAKESTFFANDPKQDKPSTPEEEEKPIDRIETPCEFDFSTIKAGEIIPIDCMLDLKGKTINIPSNVTFKFDKGDIINGTLNFTESGKIDDLLLNSSLKIKGDVTMTDQVFDFLPNRWGIVEGKVSQNIAERNTDILQKMIDDSHNYGANVFKIGKMDAYFYEDGLSATKEERFYTFTLHSNFTLEMSNQTHLRSFLNTDNNSFIVLLDLENAHVKGGHLHGYRNEPGFNSNTTQHLIQFTTCIDCSAENVNMSFATADGITINSSLLAWCVDPSRPGCGGRIYKPSRRITVKGCTFDSNRRLNLSVTDGKDITIDDCHFFRAGIDLEHSKGIAPRFSIDIEPVGQGGEDPQQIVERVTISNCTEEGSFGGIIIASGDDITVTGCTIENSISYIGGSYVKILNNPSLGGIAAGAENDDYSFGRSIGNIISGNTIKNGGAGIFATNKDVKIFNNKIIDCKVGMLLNNLQDAEVYDNIISSRAGISGQGINSSTGGLLNNVIIRDNIINVDNKSINIIGANTNNPEHKDNTFTMLKNTFNGGSTAIFQGVSGCNFLDNKINNFGIRLDGAINFNIERNTIISNNWTGLQIGQNITDNLTIKDNTIECLNKSRAGHAIFADKITTNDNKNIVITGNTLKTTLHHNGVNIIGYNGITVSNNTGTSESLGRVVLYKGDNASFTNNKHTITDFEVYNVEGNNNSIR